MAYISSFRFYQKNEKNKSCVLVQYFCVSSVLHLWTNVSNVHTYVRTKFIRIMPGINYSMLHVAIIVVVVVIVIVVVHLYLHISIMQHMLSYSRVDWYTESPFFCFLFKCSCNYILPRMYVAYSAYHLS